MLRRKKWNRDHSILAGLQGSVAAQRDPRMALLVSVA